MTLSTVQPRAQVYQAPAPWPPTSWGRVLILIAAVIVVAGVAAALVRAGNGARHSRSVALAVPAPTSMPPRQPISLRVLRAVDVLKTQEAAKVDMIRDYPAAESDIHNKTFTFRLSNVVFTQARLSWEWGCNCLEGLSASAEWGTWQAKRDGVVACLQRELGKPTQQSPPFHYHWAAQGDAPRIAVGPEMVTITLGTDRSQAGWHRAIDVLASCSDL